MRYVRVCKKSKLNINLLAAASLTWLLSSFVELPHLSLAFAELDLRKRLGKKTNNNNLVDDLNYGQHSSSSASVIRLNMNPCVADILLVAVVGEAYEGELVAHKGLWYWERLLLPPILLNVIEVTGVNVAAQLRHDWGSRWRQGTLKWSEFMTAVKHYVLNYTIILLCSVLSLLYELAKQ